MFFFLGGELCAHRLDLVVELFVETPTHLSSKQKELLKQFASECSDKCHPESQGFFKKVKKRFEQDSRA